MKPIGSSGIVRMTETPTGAKAEYLKVSFPCTKTEQELLIAEGFLKSPPESPFHFLALTGASVEQNSENHFDFTLTSRNGIISYLELTECAPFERGITGYEAAPAERNSYDLASRLMNQIRKKSAKYGSAPKGGLNLLLYETDWKFMPSQTTLALLQYWSLIQTHIFTAIFWYHPVEISSGITQVIFPTPTRHWAHFSPGKYRDSTVINLSPAHWTSPSEP
jgi:hypothetical protein